MAAKLRHTVHVPNPETGLADVYPAGSAPPEDVAARITNPSAWEDAPNVEAQDAETEPVDADEVDSDTVEPDAIEEPPRTGKGSGVKAWRDYLDRRGIPYPEGASRDDLIEVADAARDEDPSEQ